MGAKQLIANELLAFLNHAIHYMDEVSILQICRSNFKEEEISSGKLLLFQSLGKLDQMPSRRRDGTDKSLQDIIDMLKKTDPDDIPDFVAKELDRLPPVTFDHVDVTRLLKDITSLKASLAEMQSKLEVSNNTVEELRTEVVLLRNAVSLSRSPDASKVNTRRGAQNASISSFASASATASPVADIAYDASCHTAAAVPALSPVEESTRVGTSTPKRAYAAIAATSKPAASQSKRQQQRDKQSCETIRKDPSQGCPEKDRCDEDGFIKVEKKKRKKPACQNKCGTAPTGPNHLLRPAVPETLLYVSRLHYSTKVEEIVEYIRIKAKFTLRVKQLDSRHNVNFNSFVVRVPTEHLPTFTKEEFWPKGVVFRRFRGRIPDTAKHTTPI